MSNKDTLKRKSYGGTVSSRRMRRKAQKHSPIVTNVQKKIERRSDDEDDDSFTIHLTQEVAAGARSSKKKSPKRGSKNAKKTPAKIKVKPLQLEKKPVSSSKKSTPSPAPTKSPKKQETSKRQQVLVDLKRGIQSCSLDLVESKLAMIVPAFARTPDALFDSVPLANLPLCLEDDLSDTLMDIIKIFSKKEAFVSVFCAALLFQARKSFKVTKKFLDVLNCIDSIPSHFISFYLTKLAEFCIAESVTGFTKVKKTKVFQRGVKLFHHKPSFSSEDGLYSEGVKIGSIASVHVSKFSLSFLSHNEIVFLPFDDSLLIKVDANQHLIELNSCSTESSTDPLTIFITADDFPEFFELLQSSKYAKLASFDIESCTGGSVMTSDLPVEVNTAYLWNNLDYTQRTNATDNIVCEEGDDSDLEQDQLSHDEKIDIGEESVSGKRSVSDGSSASNNAPLQGSNPSQGTPSQVSRDVSADIKISNATQPQSHVTQSDESEMKEESSSKCSGPTRIFSHATTKQVTPIHQTYTNKLECESASETGYTIQSSLMPKKPFSSIDHVIMQCFLSTSKKMRTIESNEAITGTALAISELLSSLGDNVLPIQDLAKKLLSFDRLEDDSLLYKDDVRAMLEDIMHFSESLSAVSQKWGETMNKLQAELSSVLLNNHNSNRDA